MPLSQRILPFLAIAALISCAHPYFKLVESGPAISSEPVDQAKFVMEVDTPAWKYVGAFHTHRRTTPEAIEDTLLNRAQMLGANAIHLTKYRFDGRGGIEIDGELFRATSLPDSPLDNPQLQLVILRDGYPEDRDTSGCVIQMIGESPFKLPTASYVIRDYPVDTEMVKFKMNGEYHTIQLHGRDKLIRIDKLKIRHAAGSAPALSPGGGGFAPGVYIPIYSTEVRVGLTEQEDTLQSRMIYQMERFQQITP